MARSTSQWAGTPSIKGSSESTRMVLLTFVLVGLQFAWGLESTYCTPYLLSLGLPKSQISLVFIAGPLSGLLVQPIVGAIADRSTSKYGRRRPIMVVGAIIVAAVLLLLGWTKEVVAYFVKDEKTQARAAVATAITIIYVVDFAINAVSTCCRSLIVDTLPLSRQQEGSAWASRVGGFGHLVSFGVGTLNLVSIMPAWLGGDTQFKKMTLISVFMVLTATGITCYAVHERVLISSPDHAHSIWGILPSIWHRTFNLPPRMQAICWVQFWAWIGWFPFLFYSSTWVGETYYRYEHEPAPNESKDDALGNIGRLGSLSLVLFSIINFTGSIFLPYLVQSSDTSHKKLNSYTPRPPKYMPQALQRIVEAVSRLPKPDLVTAWQMSHLAFAAITIWSPFVRSLAGATLVVALCGIPWAVTVWAPFSEMGIEINKLSTSQSSYKKLAQDGNSLAEGAYQAGRPVFDDNDDETDEIELTVRRRSSARSSSVLRLAHPDEGEDEEESSTGELAGIYLGVLNVYVTLPQFIGTFIGWVIFSIFEPDRSGLTDDDAEHHQWLDTKGINGISVCFFVGAISAIGAAEATRRLKRLG